MKVFKSLLLLFSVLCYQQLCAQETFPINGITDKRSTIYAFTNARIFIDYKTVIGDGTLIIKNDAIVDIGKNLTIPKGAIAINCKGLTIYPAFIDAYSDYGIPELKTKPKEGQGPQFVSNTKGAYGWNQAIRPELEVYRYFVGDNKKGELYRAAGFGTVHSLNKDGICRGVSLVTLLTDEKEHFTILTPKTGLCFSFDKGSSTQDYPDSHMGAIALLRQTYLDAQWYAAAGSSELNITLQSFNDNKSLPSFFETSDWQATLRADKIGDENGLQYIIKGGGDEYLRIDEIKKTNATLIVPVNFPDAYDVADPWDAINVSLAQMKHWELAPTNLAALDKAGIKFCITMDGLKDKKEFLRNVRKSLDNGLREEAALQALTVTPAQVLGISKYVGALQKGMKANFIITTKGIFDKDNVITENWCNGKRYIIKSTSQPDVRGHYTLYLNNIRKGTMTIGGDNEPNTVTLTEDTMRTKGNIVYNNEQWLISYESKAIVSRGMWKLNVASALPGKELKGSVYMPNGDWQAWNATFDSTYTITVKVDSSRKDTISVGNVWYPNMAYGFTTLPKSKTTLIKNATVWTNELQGIMLNTDVLLRDGKIAQIGANIVAPDAEVIDGSGKHITCGIIDEHSHIAVTGSVNECTQSVTSEVRIGDVIDCEDINIYRQLAGGVTCAHILHGSCNPIGGQTQLIKLRYGQAPEQMKYIGWPGYIKFALGENVKQSNWGDNSTTRYPQTRMGVEQTYYHAFTRAREYERAWKNYMNAPSSQKLAMKPIRKDLELDALVEILNAQRFITCHSYVQSEINMLMHVADSFDFKVNTFTHILEGYKVADKMKAHGAGASSFSDWWAYKFEVYEAIPYNGKILHQMGITTAYNSDDAEMARRLNQEAAKAVRYGNLSPEEAWKFVTLNPAKLLRIDNKVGSVKVGKDADIVLWSDNPLSVYARVLKTFVDGICYYDSIVDVQKQKEIASERARLIAKMIEAKNKGQNMQGPSFKGYEEKHCNDREHHPYQY